MRRIYFLSFMAAMLSLVSCNNKNVYRTIDVEEEMEEIHADQPLLDYEGDDYFLEIPVAPGGSFINEEVSDGDDNHLIVRSYSTTAKAAEVFEFYKTELPKLGWEVDESRTTTSPDFALYTLKNGKELNVGTEDENKFHLTMIIPKKMN